MAGPGAALGADDPGAPPPERWPIGGAAIATAAELAVAHWGTTPCHGHVAVSWTHLRPGVNATSDWAYVGPDPYGTPAANSECSIELSVDADWNWDKLCTVIVHEVGHLDGHDHADDPGDVMSTQYGGPVAECAATEEPQAGDEVLSSYFSLPAVPGTAAKKAAPKARPTARSPVRRARRPASKAKTKRLAGARAPVVRRRA